MGAVALKQPSFALDEVSAKRLAVAIQNVQAQYPFVIDPKMQAWMNLAAIGGIIYVPRVIALANASKKPKAVPQRPAEATAEPTREEVLSAAPIVQPDYKGPTTPSELFGRYSVGG